MTAIDITVATRRYPVEPLLQLSGMGKAALQRHLKVAGREWVRYWSEGMSARVADRCANRCGFHPAEVWPSWTADALEDLRRRQTEWKRRWRNTPRGRESSKAATARWREECRDYKRATDRERAARLRAEDVDRARAAQREWWAANRDRVNAERRARRKVDKNNLYKNALIDLPQVPPPTCGMVDP